MYLVRLPETHPVQWLFVHADPRLEGCRYPVESHVHYSDETSPTPTSGDPADLTRFVLGRMWSGPKHYRRFIRNGAAIEPEFERLQGAALELSSWRHYAMAMQKPFTVMLRRRGPLLCGQEVAARGEVNP